MMNTYNMNQYQQYQQNQVNTASPEQILLMLYDGAIRFTRRAIAGVEDSQPALKVSGISKAMAIIAEFSNSLNHDIGGQIAEDLDALYHFMMRELTSANLNNDINKLRNVEKLLMDLRLTWGEAVEINRKEIAAVSTNHQQDSYSRLAVSS
jgi:flagellar secretion chaperone FliS